jgi:hypothetical protein
MKAKLKVFWWVGKMAALMELRTVYEMGELMVSSMVALKDISMVDLLVSAKAGEMANS